MRALHLVGCAPALGELVAEVEFRVAVAPGEGGAVLVLEPGLHHGLQHTGFLYVFHALRQQALADGEARERLLLDDEHLDAALAQQASRHRASGPGADDQYLHLFRFHINQPCSACCCEACRPNGRNHGDSTQTAPTPESIVMPNACSAGVEDSASSPNASSVLAAPSTMAVQDTPSPGCSSKNMP
ncbi:hypothetical protein D3C86_1705150 [compost metagenome]